MAASTADSLLDRMDPEKIFKGQIAQMVNIFAPCFDGTVKDEEYLAFLFISPHRCCCCMERGGCAPAKPQKHIFICFQNFNFFLFSPQWKSWEY